MAEITDKPNQEYRILSVDLSAPEPPKFVEPRSGEGLILYGEDNMYPDYLISLYESSPKHNSLINHKVRYATSAGFAVKKLGKSMEHIAGFNAIINEKNDKGDNLNRIGAKCDLDFEIFDGFCAQMIWTKNGKKAVPYHMPFNLVRAFIVKEGSSENAKTRMKYCYLPNWKNVKTLDVAKGKPGYKEFDPFGTNKTGNELLYYKSFRPTKSGESDAYPIPYYIGAIPYIECDIEVAAYCVNGIHNDFGGNKMITFTNGAPQNEEQKNLIENKFKRKYAGGKNARRVILNFVDSADQKPIIDTMGTEEIGQQFEVLNKQIREELFTAHNVTNAAIFGIPTEGALSGRNELLEGYELFNAIWTVPRQNILECEFEYMFTAQGLVPDLYLQPVKPLGFQFSENVIVQALDAEDLKNEVYKQLGMTRKKDQVKTILSSEVNEEELNLKYLEDNSANEDENIIDSFKVELTDKGFPKYTDSGYKALYLAKIFDISLTDLEAEIISAYASNPKLSVDDLATALDATTDEITTAVDKLKTLKILSGEPGQNVSVTKKGEDIAKENGKPLNIEVEYTYTDEGAPPLSPKGSSRPFCQRLMALARSGKTWTRKQIEAMKNSEGKSAWIYRGGFYTHPDGGETTPFCRHHWKAVIKKRKG